MDERRDGMFILELSDGIEHGDIRPWDNVVENRLESGGLKCVLGDDGKTRNHKKAMIRKNYKRSKE